MKPEKGVGLLIGIGKPKSSPPEDDGGHDTKRAAAKAVFKAIQRDDFEAFEEALSMYMDECKSEEAPEDDDAA